jgi:hypothetical protein
MVGVNGDRDRDTNTNTNTDTDRQAGDDFHAEVSDLRTSGSAAPAGAAVPPAHSPLGAHLTPRQRFFRLSIMLCALLVAVVILWSAGAGLRNGRPAPSTTPAATALPNTDLIYLLPNPPGVVVLLDGRPLAHLPIPGSSQPLRLAHGAHRLTWQSASARSAPSPPLPMRQTECQISVPASVHDTCPVEPLQTLPQELRVLPGSIIGLHASLATLEPGPASSLQQAIELAFVASAATAVVQPGERYYGQSAPSAAPQPIVAHQPLRATLTYEWVPAGGYSEPCILAEPAIPCRFPGQNCGMLCTVTAPPASVGAGPNEWIAAALVHATWRYTTLDGFNVTTSAEDLGIQLLVLRITWDGTDWHVRPIFGHTHSFDVTDDPVCDPARFWLSQSSVWSFMMVNPPPGAQMQFASDANPADGCVAALNQAPGDSGQLAIFLERFGVLLTINDMARDNLDNFPVADAAEQALAARLMAQLHL